MEAPKLVQAQFTPFRCLYYVPIHPPSEAPEVAGERGIRHGVGRAPGVARNCVNKHRHRRNCGQGPPQILRRKEGSPWPKVGGGEPRIRSWFLDATSFHVPAEVLESD